ncbi:MAG: imidazolonepropionase [Bacteroidia bacterium]|nr:imidazolonepropionase [Bacteroidia bacterium]
MDLLLTSIRRLYTINETGKECLRGADMATPSFLDDAFLYASEGKVVAIGYMQDLPDTYSHAHRIDCDGRFVLPGFIDSHTHLVYPRSRHEEFVDRIRGLSYEEIGQKGGGILNSAKHTAAMSVDDLYTGLVDRANEIMAMGTTTVEIKSGYGLTLESELNLLRAARRLQQESPIRVKTTFLGAHAIPQAYKQNRQGYLDLVCDKMLPAVAAEGLADYVDVFCDRGYFTPEDTIYLLQKAAEYGLPGKIHANELGRTGGVQAGVAAGAFSVDHLEECGEEEIEALRGTDTVPCLLPTVAFFLGIPYGPARDLIAADLPVALATDYNPGSSPGGSIPFVMSLACTQLKMLPEEALSAVTLNAAFALRESSWLGALAPGYAADFLITTPMESLAQLPYYYASNYIERVFIGGVEVLQ